MNDLYWVDQMGENVWAVRADEHLNRDFRYRTVEEFDTPEEAEDFVKEMNGFSDILNLYGEQMGEGD